MLSVDRYNQEHIDASRARVDAQLSTYRALVRAAKKTKASPLASALDSFEPVFFNNMLLVLDSSKSILGYHVGDEIRVTEAEFVRLSDAFFSEMEKKYT